MLSAQSGYFKLGFLAAVCLFFLYCSDLYAPSSLRNSPAVAPRFIKGLGIACLVVAPIYYVVPSLQLFHGFAIMGISLAALFLVSHRQVFFAVNKSTEYLESVVILGEGRMASNVARVIQHRPELGLQLLGYLGSEWYSSFDVKQPMHLGGVEDIASLASQNHIGRVIVAMGDQRKKLPLDDLLALKTSGVIIQDATDFYEVAMGKLPVETLRLSWLIFSPGFKVSTVTLIYKRGVSLLLATIGLLLLLPLIALIVLAIRLDFVPVRSFFGRSESAWADKLLPCSSSEPCMWTPTAADMPVLLNTTISESPRLAGCCGDSGWTRYRSFTTFFWGICISSDLVLLFRSRNWSARARYRCMRNAGL